MIGSLYGKGLEGRIGLTLSVFCNFELAGIVYMHTTYETQPPPLPPPLPFRELFMYSSGYLYNESILERMETHHFKEKSINMTVLSGLHDLHLICHYGQAGNVG